MEMKPMIHLRLRNQVLQRDSLGYNRWEIQTTTSFVPTNKVCLIICDMWDQHWSRGAAERVKAMAPRMNAVIKAARARGVSIIHAPSETLKFYANTPARLRMKGVRRVSPPQPVQHLKPALPIDDSDGGSDTGEKPWSRVWTRQHPTIEIDQEHDYLSDDGKEIYSFCRQNDIEQILIMGVHTNMCILDRSFGIMQMVCWGAPIALVRDMTDALYNPAMPPYTNHEDGTRLVVEYIEKFWCPTVLSKDLAE